MTLNSKSQGAITFDRFWVVAARTSKPALLATGRFRRFDVFNQHRPTAFDAPWSANRRGWGMNLRLRHGRRSVSIRRERDWSLSHRRPGNASQPVMRQTALILCVMPWKSLAVILRFAPFAPPARSYIAPITGSRRRGVGLLRLPPQRSSVRFAQCSKTQLRDCKSRHQAWEFFV